MKQDKMTFDDNLRNKLEITQTQWEFDDDFTGCWIYVKPVNMNFYSRGNDEITRDQDKRRWAEMRWNQIKQDEISFVGEMRSTPLACRKQRKWNETT